MSRLYPPQSQHTRYHKGKTHRRGVQNRVKSERHAMDAPPSWCPGAGGPGLAARAPAAPAAPGAPGAGGRPPRRPSPSRQGPACGSGATGCMASANTLNHTADSPGWEIRDEAILHVSCLAGHCNDQHDPPSSTILACRATDPAQKGVVVVVRGVLSCRSGLPAPSTLTLDMGCPHLQPETTLQGTRRPRETPLGKAPRPDVPPEQGSAARGHGERSQAAREGNCQELAPRDAAFRGLGRQTGAHDALPPRTGAPHAPNTLLAPPTAPPGQRSTRRGL